MSHFQDGGHVIISQGAASADAYAVASASCQQTLMSTVPDP